MKPLLVLQNLPVLLRCLVQHMRREPPRGCIRFLRWVPQRARTATQVRANDRWLTVRATTQLGYPQSIAAAEFEAIDR